MTLTPRMLRRSSMSYLRTAQIRSSNARYRSGRLAVVVALVAMLLQVVAAGEHLSALAYRAAAGDTNSPPISLLEICSGSGLIRLGPDGRPQGDHGHAPFGDCLICSAFAAVSGADVPAIPEITHPIADHAIVPAPELTNVALLQPAYRRAPARAPPSFLSV